MSNAKDPRVSRRDTLRLASAAGALGAGLGITLSAGSALAADSYKHKFAAADIGTMALKIRYVGPDGSEQLVTALDLTATFLKLQSTPGSSVAVQLGSQKDKWIPIYDHAVSVTQMK
jgi:hypothetical protein